MIHFRAPLLGGVCCIGLMFQFASVDIVHAATTVEMPGVRDAALTSTVESAMPALLADEAAINYGYETTEDAMETAEDESASPESPAWAAPAKMNPDYATDESAAPAAPSESNTEAAPTQTAEEAAPPPTGGQATTEYYGNGQTPNNPAWAAPAAMNPDYTNEPAAPAEQAQPAATEAPAQTAEEAAPPPTGGQATTEYYGDSPTPNNPAWAAPAAMNPDYTSEPAAPAETAQPAATEAPAPAPTAEEPPPPPTGGQATTDYYGGSETPNNPAWAAPAAMNPDYNAAAAPAATEAAAPSANACRETAASSAKAAILHYTEDSAAIPQESRAALKDLANALKDCSGVVVEVQGYTDSVGSSGSNKMLSELRAKKIVDFLTDEGVDASKLRAVGNGEEHPVADNGTSRGRQLNRRVEFVVSGQ